MQALMMSLLLTATGAAHGDVLVVRHPEHIAGITTEYGQIDIPSGDRLRTLITFPTDRPAQRLPVVHFVQWLSCDSVVLSERSDGWTQFLKGLVAESGLAVSRLEKSGVGDSTGRACSELDYDTELSHHLLALQALQSNPNVDAGRLIIVGASMGATMAPILAAVVPVRGVAVWGGGAHTWHERMMAFERNAAELSGDPARVEALPARFATLHALLVQSKSPSQLDDFAALLGADDDLLFGRPAAFHQQAARRNWTADWARVDASALVMVGEYDWYETLRSHRSIARVAPRVRLVEISRMDHHFSTFASAADAFRDSGGVPDARPVLNILLPWLRQAVEAE